MVILLSLNSISLMAQVGINTTTPDTNSVLDIVSTTKGLLIPRLNQTQANVLAGELPANGMLIYNTDSKCLQIYQLSSPTTGAFECLVISGNVDISNDAWINDTSNSRIFLNTQSDGTTLRTTGTEFTINDSDGKVGIGTIDAENQLHVKSTLDST
ncbi:hypothetical protein [Chryseobacterium indoltheticum]|uniref:hypothetical protein n=1 Tax=Chryseobacterium indoltheticum TaxID=254 RepID=UPI003F49955E